MKAAARKCYRYTSLGMMVFLVVFALYRLCA